MLLPNGEQMRQIDHCAINRFHIPGIVLMENAGLGTVLMVERRFGPLRETFIPVFVGPGNNGGTGWLSPGTCTREDVPRCLST